MWHSTTVHFNSATVGSEPSSASAGRSMLANEHATCLTIEVDLLKPPFRLSYKEKLETANQPCQPVSDMHMSEDFS